MAINWARNIYGSAAFASSLFSSPTYSTYAAINGIRHTSGSTSTPASSWCSSTGTYPQWLEIDFFATRTINRIHVYGTPDGYSNATDPTPYQTFSSVGNTAFKVQYWTGSAYRDIASVTGNNRVLRVFEFAPITTTKIRIYITGAQDAFSRIVEVEAWGAETPRVFPLEFSDLTSSVGFNTTINRGTVSGYEQRIKQRSRAKDRFNAALAIQTLDDARKLNDFFLNCNGKFHTFLLKDPSDFTFERTRTELDGNGSLTDFQIRKRYSDTLGNHYYRPITKPIEGTVNVYVNGQLFEDDIVLHYDTGILTFVDPPATNAVIEIEGEFYKNCRFDTDFLDNQLLEFWLLASEEEHSLVQPPEIPMVEVFE